MHNHVGIQGVKGGRWISPRRLSISNGKTTHGGNKMADIREGDLAPEFHLENDQGESMSLRDFSGKNVILYFYPKDMTSGCTQQAKDFKKYAPRFAEKGWIVLG